MKATLNHTMEVFESIANEASNPGNLPTAIGALHVCKRYYKSMIEIIILSSSSSPLLSRHPSSLRPPSTDTLAAPLLRAVASPRRAGRSRLRRVISFSSSWHFASLHILLLQTLPIFLTCNPPHLPILRK
ncbi:hypothetical protein PIB30_065530 [Stylosanthes scabra]|uniref:Uncharacterized protein n=1 Tax=Stylosanthes scabra TaxID=79078 RepID=A0ABU6RM16_9FABA|nr:hypothetical protein [Stylosanthes scabra]